MSSWNVFWNKCGKILSKVSNFPFRCITPIFAASFCWTLHFLLLLIFLLDHPYDLPNIFLLAYPPWSPQQFAANTPPPMFIIISSFPADLPSYLELHGLFSIMQNYERCNFEQKNISHWSWLGNTSVLWMDRAPISLFNKPKIKQSRFCLSDQNLPT